tara:strand:- start:1092 stop:1277 length:186 start_codon:yes stop_codon:yes gene_type:complete
MNTFNSINSLALDKLLKKYKLISKNKKQVILVAQRIKAACSALYRFARKLEFKNSVIQQQQ